MLKKHCSRSSLVLNSKVTVTLLTHSATVRYGEDTMPNTSDEVYTFIAGINEPTNPFSAEMGVGYNIETIEGTAPP